MKKIAVILLCLMLGCVVIIGGYKGVTILIEKYEVSKAEERKRNIEDTLYQLGNRSLGTHDWSTGQYSMALGFVERAALGESKLSNHAGMNKEEIKKSSLEYLEAYFETDYLKSYAALVFGADYLTKYDVEYFYKEGEQINTLELQEQVEELMYKDFISLGELLINPQDKEICYTVSLHIKLAEAGCVTPNEIVANLRDFVYEGKGIAKVKEEYLAEKITYSEIIANHGYYLAEEKIYFDDLSAVGKMVFLYLMPRYVLEADQEAGSLLWYRYFESEYEKCWKEIIERDMFSGIVHQ